MNKQKAQPSDTPLGELDNRSDLPPGPYGTGLPKGPGGDLGPPHTVTCGTGQAVAGHIPSRAIAEKIADALNIVEASRNQMQQLAAFSVTQTCELCGHPRPPIGSQFGTPDMGLLSALGLAQSSE